MRGINIAKVLYEKRNRIGHITLNRPDVLNALDKETILDVVGCTLEDALRLETLNAYLCLGDFSEARERLAQFYSKGKDK